MTLDGDTDDIIKVILFADERSEPLTSDFARKLQGRNTQDTLYNIWHFVRHEIQYVADRPGHEKVKSPSRLWADGQGDCKSFSIFTGSVLKNLKIPFSYRFVAWEDGEEVTRVYVVAHTRKGDVLLDSVHTTFDEEAPFYIAYDYPIGAEANGEYAIKYGKISGTPPTQWSWKKALLWLGGSWLTYKLFFND